MEPSPFVVEISDEALADLKRRLRQTRWADDFGNRDWRYGVERSWLEEMVRYWSEEFDWRSQEAAINHFPQFRVVIDSVPIHFIHARADGTKPLILTHGWPWTFWDWKDTIEPLVASGFDVIVPSLPGYGFSAPLRTTGIDTRRIAALWVRLMHDILGYGTFAAAGCDWGALVTSELGHAYGQYLRGIWVPVTNFPGNQLRDMTDDMFADDEAWMIERRRQAFPKIQAHRTLQTYEPQSIAYAFADSPTGTAAWLWMARQEWSDCDGDVLSVFDRDFLCTTASIYWLTGTIATSFRLYYENFVNGPPPPLHKGPRMVEVPTAICIFPKDVNPMPRAVAERVSNLQRWTVQERGGHFSPSEQPQLVVDDLRAFFG